LGGVSCVFWTLTSSLSLKYIYLALNADNKGEGGIFATLRIGASLQSALGNLCCHHWLLHPHRRWIYYASDSISSAVEGVKLHYPGFEPAPIVIGILFLLFFFQQFGTSVVGKTFGRS